MKERPPKALGNDSRNGYDKKLTERTGMDWRDDGIILSLRKHGEFDAIIEALTREHGRHGGLVKGGVGRRLRGVLQPGNEVELHWRGRLESHLGAYQVELRQARSAAFLHSPQKLAVLNAVTALLTTCLPEREEHAPLLDGMIALLDVLQQGDGDVVHWGPLLVRWELGLLGELGFGLDLSCCAATGDTGDLVYVSPKSGRAVSRTAGKPYHDRLLALPAFLLGTAFPPGTPRDVMTSEIRDGLALTEFFLDRHMLTPHGKKMPQARRLLLDHLR